MEKHDDRRVARMVSVHVGSFEEFYEREYRPVLALARVMTGDRERAEDVAQDAFAAAVESWGDIDNPTAWIRRVVANKANSTWRGRYAERRALVRLESEVRLGADIPDETDDFWGEVRRLPRRQAQAVALFYLEDRPVAEIASIIGCEAATARVHLMRGRRALADRLGLTE